MTASFRDQLQASLSGDYTLERELGGGGMSRVFVATDPALDRRVVVKVLSPELTQGLSAERFAREIRLAARLQHPHIVPVHAAGETAGVPYYTMPFVEGESLRARLGRGALGIGEAAGILREVAKALAYAHERGIVHRDIKPENVMLSGGSAVVLDFGIAKALSAARAEQPSPPGGATRGGLTQVGMSIGTPMYMAPEQAAADPSTDHRADLYAFGCLAYELLAGRPPFAGTSPQRLLAAHLAEVPAPVETLRADVPPPLAQLVARCLEKEREARPQSAADVARLLDAVTTGGSGQAAAASSALLARRLPLPVALGAWAGATLAVAVLARAAVVGIGLPDWVFPAALVVMALGLPAVLFTAFVQRAAQRALTTTPTLTPGGTPAPLGTMATLALRASPHVSWKRTWRAGAISVGTLVLATVAIMVLREFGIGPAAALGASEYDAEQPLIVSDFAVAGQDTLLGAAVAEAVKQDLLQSDRVQLATAAEIAGALRTMRRPPGTALTYAVAREVAPRIGAKAVVDGSVRPLGAGFLVTVRLTTADSGRTLVTYSGAADSPSELIATVGSLTRQLRGKLGESLRRVQGGPRLEQVSTASLDALRAYTEGVTLSMRTGDRVGAIRAFKRAIALDSSFADAYRKVGTELTNLGGRGADAIWYLRRAYELRERLPELERYMIEGVWWRSGPEPDLSRSAAAYEALLAVRPTYTGAMNNLALARRELGDHAAAESLYRRAIAANPQSWFPWSNLANLLNARGRSEEALRLLDSARRVFPGNAEVDAWQIDPLVSVGREDSARALAHAIVARPASGIRARTRAAQALLVLDQRAGRAREADGHLELLREMTAERGAALYAAGDIVWERAMMDAVVRGDRESAGRQIDSLIGSGWLDSLPPDDRPYLDFADIAALSGRLALAQDLLARGEAQVPWGPTNPIQHRVVRHSRGVVAIGEGRYDDALRELRASLVGGDSYYHAVFWMGLAHDLAGRRDSAIVHYERALVEPATGRTTERHFGAIPFRLGELYEEKGDLQRAAAAYAMFAERWKDADPEFQPRVREALARAERLRRRLPS